MVQNEALVAFWINVMLGLHNCCVQIQTKYIQANRSQRVSVACYQNKDSFHIERTQVISDGAAIGFCLNTVPLIKKLTFRFLLVP